MCLGRQKTISFFVSFRDAFFSLHSFLGAHSGKWFLLVTAYPYKYVLRLGCRVLSPFIEMWQFLYLIKEKTICTVYSSYNFVTLQGARWPRTPDPEVGGSCPTRVAV